MTGAALKCTCCNGTGVVLSATGSLRPCSRCRTDDFITWAGSRLVEKPNNGEKADDSP